MINKILNTNKFNELVKGKNGYCLYNKNDIYIGKSVEQYGEFSELEADMFAQICYEDDIVIEVGANIGTHTQIFSRLVGKKGAVIAYEPQRIVYQTLCANMALNSITNVYAHQKALGSQNGSIRIPEFDYSKSNNFGGISLDSFENGIEVDKETLDGLIDKMKRLKLVKIDVEGMEIDVLKGAKKLLDKFKPFIYIENDRQEKSKELIELISSYGYDMYWHLPALYNANNFAKDSKNIFGNIVSVNMICVHKDVKVPIKGLQKVIDSSYHPMAKSQKTIDPEIEKIFKEAIEKFEKKDFKKAKKLYEEIIKKQENSAEAYCGLGVVTKAMGDVEKSIPYYIKAIELNPKYILTYNNLGNAYKALNQYNKSIDAYISGLKINPNNANTYNNLGMAYEGISDYENSINSYKKAISINPKYAKAVNNLAVVLYKIKRYDESVNVFKIALDIDPEYYEVYSNLGAALNKAKSYDESIEALQTAIKHNPKHGGAYTNLGNVYNKLHDYKEAVKCHEKSIKLEPNGSNAYSNVGTSYKNLGFATKAIASYKKAIEIEPDFENAHFDLATVYLAKKDFVNGWKEYEWRFQKDEMAGHIAKHQNIFNATRFDGKEDIKGKKLLIHTEQGFGDSIMFGKFVDSIKDKFECEVILQCRDELKSIFKNSFKNIDIFYSRDADDIPEFDFHYPMLSLPLLFNMSSIKDIPKANPYLIPKDEKDLDIKKDDKKINIGICWSASVTGESYDGKVFDIEYFRPIIEHSKFNVYTLQVGPENEELEKAGLKDKVIDITDKLTDFNKTAYLMKQLDLVISSDTSVAHLSGAINKEVIVPLQKIPDWRWENKGENSYWYPSAKLYRQKSARVWDGVFQSIYAKMNKQYKVRLKLDKKAK